VLTCHDHLPYDLSSFQASLVSVLEQEGVPVEAVVVDARGSGAPPDFLPAAYAADGRVIHLPGDHPDRAARHSAALRHANGDWILLIDNEPANVVLRRWAVRAMLMAARRRRRAGLVYADYCRVDGEARRAVHLLDHHPGRLRETFDTGPVLLLPVRALREAGGVNPRFKIADLYDLRLRIAERYDLVHLGAGRDGELYEVHAPAAGHDVFDYLLADRAAQAEFEQALTGHLQRTGAWLDPDLPLRRVTYTPTQEERFRQCRASVVIPVNRRPEFIGTAIESALAQTVPEIEVIVVVNGGEADPTTEAVQAYLPGGSRHDPAAPPVRLLVLDVNNIGLCLNAGIEAARGKYYVQLDSDDRLKPDAVERLLAVLDSDPGTGMVIGSYEVWELDPATGRASRRADLPVVRHEEWKPDNGRNNLLRTNGAGAPRAAHIKVIREVGGFGLNDDPHCRNYGEDYDLVLRISERYRIGRVTEPVYDVVRHSGGTDHTIDQATIDRNDNAKDHLRRQALRRRQALNRRQARRRALSRTAQSTGRKPGDRSTQ